MVIPYTTQNQKARRGVDQLHLRPRQLRQAGGLRPVRAGAVGYDRRARQDRPRTAAKNPLINPPEDDAGQAEVVGAAHRRADPGVQHRCTQPSPAADAMAGVASSSRQRSKIAPYLMVLPALVYLGDLLRRAVLSRWPAPRCPPRAGSIYLPTLTFEWDFGNYGSRRSAPTRTRSSGRSPTQAVATDPVHAAGIPAGLRHRVQGGSLQEPASSVW